MEQHAPKEKSPLLLAALTLLLLSALLSGLFFCLDGVITDRDYYARRYAELDIQTATGISAAECTEAVYRLVAYMHGWADSIQLTVTENGQRVEMYNQQEIEHMVDVRALFQGFRTFAVITLCLLAVVLALCLWKRRLAPLRRAFGYAWAVFGALVLCLGAWVLLDFNSFWTAFHLLFFTNDLWLMDPAYCRMIRICPLELFYGIVIRTGLLFVGCCGVLPAVVLRLSKKRA